MQKIPLHPGPANIAPSSKRRLDPKRAKLQQNFYEIADPNLIFNSITGKEKMMLIVGNSFAAIHRAEDAPSAVP
jgi:hypothetical protein